MTIRETICNSCNAKFELELIGYSFWERRKAPSNYECPNCSAKYYVREPEWLKSLTWNGIKISKRYNEKSINTCKDAFNVDLDSKELYRILKDKGVTYFHHANTVKTSKTFLEQKALLSREYIEKNQLFQTAQDSDDKDKKFGIHDFVFLDGKDLAQYFSQPNKYGPVLFKLNLELLLSDEIPTVRISRRKNPIHWNDQDGLNDKYYNSLKDFEKEYLTGDKLGDGRTMFMVTTTNGKLSLEKYLEEISIDNPNLILVFNEKNKVPYIEKIEEFLSEDIKSINKELKVLDRFQFRYNLMFRAEKEKYKRFFSIK